MKRISWIFNLFVILTMVFPWRNQASAAVQLQSFALSYDPAASAGIFRTTITIENTYNRNRLDELGVKIASESENSAVVVVSESQLEKLAQLGYEPTETEDLGMLVEAHAADQPVESGSLQSVIDQAQPLAAGLGIQTTRDEQETTALNDLVSQMTVEQLASAAALSAIDDDADGLTNTQESWWCTDPMNPYTREDPNQTGSGLHKDGDYVNRLLQYLYHPEQGDNRLGAPFASWPMVPGDGHFNANCLDADHDGVPDLAELYVIGSNSNAESTSHDRYDDGQKLFGLTPPNWGVLPRTADGAYASLSLPGYVQWPGRSLFAAAIAQPKISIVDSSLHMAAVTTVTTDHTITLGTEKTYSTANTEGTSTSRSDTVTWNDWQEASVSKTEHILSTNSYQEFRVLTSKNQNLTTNTDSKYQKLTNNIETESQILMGQTPQECLEYESNQGTSQSLNSQINGGVDALGINVGMSAGGEKGLNTGVTVKASSVWTEAKCKYYMKAHGLLGDEQKPTSFDPGIIINGFDGLKYTVDQSGQLVADRLYQIGAVLSSPTITTSNTSGKSWGGSYSNTTSNYVEQTVTNGQAFSNNEGWSTATAVDSAYAADLWFSYTVSNIGSDFANTIGNLTFNVYLGDDPDPIDTYYAAPEIGGDGALHNFMPGETHTYTSHHIQLNLDQMRDIDQGKPLRVVLEDYSFGADEQFYQDAVTSSLQISIDDGPNDGDQTLDHYILPTWGGSDTVLDVMVRYFPHTVDADGALTAIWTPEYSPDTPAWCQEARIVTAGGQRAVWCKHALSTADWWNIYTSGMGNGSQGLQDTPALANSVALFRFNQDSDLDGYSDATEIQLGTDPNSAASFPHPELLAGVNSIRSGSNVVSTLSLLNTGVYDAYGVEAVMVAPDDSITITNNTVGGSGRVKALKQVVVGSSILAPVMSVSTWTGTAEPASGGYFTGSADRTYTFTVNCSTPGGCDVGNGSWSLNWSDGGGGSGSLNFGTGYLSPNLVNVGALGVKLGLMSGKVVNGNGFTVTAKTPQDTFQYTINREPYSQPIVIVSYNDPQGNHRFILPSSVMSLASPTDNLISFSGQMLQDPGVEIVTDASFTPGANTTDLVVNNPAGQTLTDSKIFLDFIDPQGNVVLETSATQTLPQGPSVVSMDWDSAAFNPAYDSAQDYIVMAFWTDLQGNILDTAGRPLSSFQADPQAQFAMAETDQTWDFGTVSQGSVLKRTFTFANTGERELLTYVDAPDGLSVSQVGSAEVGAADQVSYEITLNTAGMQVGAFNQTITIHTSDPANAVRTVQVTGMVTTGSVDIPTGQLERPLDYSVTVPGPQTQGSWYSFTQPIGPDPQSIHPVKVYSQDYSKLWGVGKYATSFSAGTASYEMFGDGRDGDLTITSGQTVTINTERTNVTANASTAMVSSSSGFSVGDMVLFHQTQGTGNVGRWEYNIIQNIVGSTWTLVKPLAYTYDSSTGKAQAIKVKQYRNITIQNGGALTAPAWNGSNGGILVFLVNDMFQVSGGNINMSGRGFLGGGGGTWNPNYPGGGYGESYSGPAQGARNEENTSSNPNGGGGGGGIGRYGGGGAGGGGGASFGTSGTASFYNPAYPGAIYGSSELKGSIFLGSGGGGGGKAPHNDYNSPGGNGGVGGGIIISFSKSINIASGGIYSNGGGGGSATNTRDESGGGGGGSGGSIYLVGSVVSIGSSMVLSTGGSGGNGCKSPGENGGSGGSGRIHVEYCESLIGTAVPSAFAEKLNCYISEQIESSPYLMTRLNVPENITTSQPYAIQYSRRMLFTGSGTSTSTLRIPAGQLSSASLDTLISGVGSGSLTYSLDIDNDGSTDWTWTGNVTDSIALTDPSLAQAFNRWWAVNGRPTSGDMDVPVRASLSKAGQVLLTNLQVKSAGSTLRNVRLEAGTYSQLTLDYTLTGAITPITVGVDLGDNGTIDDTYTIEPPANPQPVTSGNLADAVSTYLTGQSGEVDIPIRFYLPESVSLQLETFHASSNGNRDASVTAGDIALPADAPTEGAVIPLSATLHNLGDLPSGGVVAAFFANSADWGEWYLGSAFVPDIPAGGSALAQIQWNTLGFTGDVPVRVEIDPYNRLAEADETNNSASTTYTIHTRPDLSVADPVLSDDEPLQGETVEIRLPIQNSGQTDAGVFTTRLYDGNPAEGGVLIGEQDLSVGAGAQQEALIDWTPTQAGAHRLFVVTDSGNVVNESSEGNNTRWMDLYIGFASPIILDSGNSTQDPLYSIDSGYGVVDNGSPDVSSTCGSGTEWENTLRRDPNGQLVYQFDHLQPSHFYHLDLVLYECDSAGRQETVTVDGMTLAGPVDLGDGQVHRLSLRLDPALYSDHRIQISVKAPGTDGAVVAAVNLHDIDYRYADAGGTNDPQYPGSNGFGWLDGVTNPDNTLTLPYQTPRVDQTDNHQVHYQFDNLQADKEYDLQFTFWQPSGVGHIQKVRVDGMDLGLAIDTGDYQIHRMQAQVSTGLYASDGSIVVTIERTNAKTGAIVNEIALEERTIMTGEPLNCNHVKPTPYFTDSYGILTYFGLPAEVGQRVEVLNPRGEVVGCYIVDTAGQYGLMHIYGEDKSTNPPTPGMRAGEKVTYRVSGFPAYATPELTFQDDHASHNVDLEVRNLTEQTMLLNPGWNLIGFNVESPAPLVPFMIAPIQSRVDRLVGETGVYTPTLADTFVTLKELHAQAGYYVLVNGDTSFNWVVTGQPVPDGTPIALHAGWNWIGGPQVSRTVETALASIAGSYRRVISLTKTYDASLPPSYNPLKNMIPGEGYLIFVTQAVNLTYPVDASLPQAPMDMDNLDVDACSSAQPTPNLTLIYGSISINGLPAPAGTKVEAITPRGEIAGCGVIEEPGILPLMHVYGMEGEIGGFAEGEPIQLRVNGLMAKADSVLTWTNDKDTHPVTLNTNWLKLFLPLIDR